MITLDQAKYHLRVDGNHEDADIQTRLTLATAIVLDYLKDSAAPTTHGADVIDAAILLVLGELYMNREGGADPLSPSVRALLERQREPTLA